MFNKILSKKRGSGSDEINQSADGQIDEVSHLILPSKIISNTQKPSILSEGAKFDGSLVFDGAIHLDGKFKGNIKADKITVGKHGQLQGKVEAKTVIVLGEVKGELVCEELTLNPGSEVDGNISYASVKIYPGGSIIGDIHCKKN
ncbi:MAG: polymer-forming cytoskeletal protein [Methylotenera sp.]